MKRRGRLKGPMGSHDRPASPLLFRLVLAVFGLVVLVVGTVLAVVLVHSVPLAIVLAAGTIATALNIFWITRRRRYER